MCMKIDFNLCIHNYTQDEPFFLLLFSSLCLYINTFGEAKSDTSFPKHPLNQTSCSAFKVKHSMSSILLNCT